MPDPSTTRLGLYKSKSDGSELVNYTQDIGQNLDKIDAAVGFAACTSSTRPSSPYSGKAIMETDTSYRTYFSNGTSPAASSWVEIPNSSATYGSNLNLSSSSTLSIGTATLSRSSGGSISANTNYQRSAAATTDVAYSSLLTGDTFDRVRIYADGKWEAGPGNAARDTNLYRSGVNTLATDDSLSVGLNLTVTGNATVTGNLTVSGIGQTLSKYKTGSTSRTSTTTNTSDPDITFNVVANATYLVEGTLFFSADPAGDMKIGWAAPASANFQWSCIGQGSTASGGAGSVATDGQDLTSTAFGLGGVTDNTKIMTAQVRGYLTVSSTAGTFALQWSQITSSANATILKPGTHVVLTRVA